MARYDRIGHGYAAHRSEDPAIKAAILAALGSSQTIVNVGAGAGSYEPEPPTTVIPIEPSAVMAAQRPSGRPAVRGVADALPLHDDSVDAAMTVLSLHHWHPNQRQGVEEMRRVARDHVIIVTIDPVVSGAMWLMADYLTEVRDLDLEIFPTIEELCAWLGDGADIQVSALETHRDTPDHNLLSFWAHPERVLDEGAREATSGFARQPDEVIARVVKDVTRDLASGAWDKKHGHLRALEAFDAGLRLIHCKL